MIVFKAELDMFFEYFDVCTVFLNGDLKETVYMKQSEGFEDLDFFKKFCWLLKALYGLK